MKKKLKADSKKLGRPSKERSVEDTILSNGLLLRQWNRIKSECGTASATEKLRFIVDWYFAQMDAESILDVANTAFTNAAIQDKKAKER